MDNVPTTTTADDSSSAGLPAVRDVNCYLTCAVCRGYLVDATTITECLHSFCRSCVVPYVTENHSCPLCDAPLSTTKPFSQLRRDYTLQTIVFKMVPRLARCELERRQQFRNKNASGAKMDERYLQSFFAPTDPISLSLEYAEPDCAFGLKRRLLAHRDGFSSVETTPSAGSQHRRYFRCPAELPIGHLVKFLRSKFDVTDPSTHKLEILYNGHPLAPEYKLSDVAYIFSWKEREPLRLWYRITPAVETIKEEVPVPEALPAESQPRASLVDITSKRSWESNATERPSSSNSAGSSSKRRKREKPAKIQRIPPPEESPPRPIEPTITKTENTATIFDEARPTEFSCSTPIPASSTPAAAEDSSGSKVLNWLPKAVFDLDDRALFAKRLEREKKTSPPPLPADEKEVNNEPKIKSEPVEIKEEVKEESSQQILTKSPELIKADDDDDDEGALRICIKSPEPVKADEEVHDSIGALDLSGSKSDVSNTSSAASPSSQHAQAGSPSPSGRASATPTGPHPYFMTPSSVFHQVQQRNTSSTSDPAADLRKSQQQQHPLWSFLQQVQQQQQPNSSSANSSRSSLLSLLFRHGGNSPGGSSRPALPASNSPAM